MLVMRAGSHKMLILIANREDRIRLLLKNQSDLGLHCLSMPFSQAFCVRNFRTFTITLQLGSQLLRNQAKFMGIIRKDL